MESSVEASRTPGGPKPALAPKPRLAPKPFSLQKNTAIRSIHAPRTNPAPKTAAPLARGPTAPAVKTPAPQPASVNKAGKDPPAEESDSPVSKPHPAPASAPPKPTSEPVPREELIKGDRGATTVTDTTPQRKDVETKIGSETITGGKESDPPEKSAESGDSSSSFTWGGSRKRLSMHLTSKFESGGPPAPPKNTSRDAPRTVPTIQKSTSETTPETKEIDKEETEEGGSIKRRISRLFEQPSKPEVVAKKEEPEIVNGGGGGGVKERIKNWTSESIPDPNKSENRPQVAPRTPKSVESPSGPTIEATTPPVKSEVENGPAVSAKDKERSQDQTRDAAPQEQATERVEETGNDSSDVKVRLRSQSLPEEGASKTPKRDNVKRRSVRFGVVERDDGGPPIMLGSASDSSSDEEEAPAEESKEEVPVPSYRRAGILHNKDGELRNQEGEQLKHLEFEKRRKVEERVETGDGEQKDEEEKHSEWKVERAKEEESEQKRLREEELETERQTELMLNRHSEQDPEKVQLEVERIRSQMDQERLKEQEKEEKHRESRWRPRHEGEEREVHEEVAEHGKHREAEMHEERKREDEWEKEWVDKTGKSAANGLGDVELREEMEEERKRRELQQKMEEERERNRMVELEMEREREQRRKEVERERQMESERQREKKVEMERQREAQRREQERAREEEMERQKEAQRREQEKAREEEMERQREAQRREEERARVEEMERQREAQQVRAREEEMERQREAQRREQVRAREEEMERQREAQRREEERARVEEMERQREAQRREQVRAREEEMERQREAQRREQEKEKMVEYARKKEEMERLHAEELKKRMEAERSLRDFESQKTASLIDFDSEDVPQHSGGNPVSPGGQIEVVYDDFSVKKPLIEVDFDDFSVKPVKWGSQTKTESSPVERKPMISWDEVLVEEIPTSPIIQPQVTVQEKVKEVTPDPTPARESPLESETKVEEEETEEGDGVEPEEEGVFSMEMEQEEAESRADEGRDVLTPQAEVDRTDVDTDVDTDVLVQSEEEETVDDEQTTEADSSTPAPEERQEEPAEEARSDLQPEPDLTPFPETSVLLLDTSAQRSKAYLSKRRSRKRPSRSLRLVVAPSEDQDWRTCDSTAASSRHPDSDAEDEPSPAKMAATPPSSHRVPMFPGMSPAALIAQLKKRGPAGDVKQDEPKEEAPGEDGPPEEAGPSLLSRSPRSAAHMAGAARVLPPIGGKEGGAASPAWLKELKSKKRLSQHDGV